MAYSEFDLADIGAKLGVTIADHPDLYVDVKPGHLSAPIQALLRVYFPLAIAIGTEKARSELLIAPVLVDLREQLNHEISLFSGCDFTVDRAKGLTGNCDYILSRSRQQEFITAPVAVIVEAKNENIKSGLGQCAAGMIAARLFNERAGAGCETEFGCVTSGNVWRFLQLTANVLLIDQKEYYLATQAEQIVGIFLHILKGLPTSSGLAA
jgi:hypothetical protein